MKTCFACKYLTNRHPITDELLDEKGYEFRCKLKYNTMKPIVLWDVEFETLKKEAIDAACHCDLFKEMG